MSIRNPRNGPDGSEENDGATSRCANDIKARRKARKHTGDIGRREYRASSEMRQ